MRCAVFSLFGDKNFVAFALKTPIQTGVEAEIFFSIDDVTLRPPFTVDFGVGQDTELPVLDKGVYMFHHNANAINSKRTITKLDNMLPLREAHSYDKIYILGLNFGLRKQLFDRGFAYNQIEMCYGNILMCRCPLDDVFIIQKRQPEEPFERKHIAVKNSGFGETGRARARRLREGFFDKYCKGEGIDIGYGGDILTPDCSGWDFRNGDAQYLSGIEDESFDFAYSSHCLEHMYDVRTALRNWFRIVKRGGYLLLAIPHRDLYEKKSQLPSHWNSDHKHMFLIGRAEPPDTLDIVEEIRESLSNYDIKYIKACDEGHTITDPNRHSDGEYQIELVIQKL